MPNWKKVIVSGSNATLNSLFVSTSVTASIFSGSFTKLFDPTLSAFDRIGELDSLIPKISDIPDKIPNKVNIFSFFMVLNFEKIL